MPGDVGCSQSAPERERLVALDMVIDVVGGGRVWVAGDPELVPTGDGPVRSGRETHPANASRRGLGGVF